MGNIGHMKGDLKKLVNMNQIIYIQDNQNRDQAMEEASMEQPVKDKKRKAAGASLASWVFYVFLSFCFRRLRSNIPFEGFQNFYLAYM